MPCYFVRSGVEIPMANETFDFVWNSLGNKELNDSETSSSSEESDKPNSSANNNKNAEWRKQKDGYYNRKPNDKTYFQKYYQEKTKQPCVRDICGSATRKRRSARGAWCKLFRSPACRRSWCAKSQSPCRYYVIQPMEATIRVTMTA